MDSTCQPCEVAWNGDTTCWVCGRQPPTYLTRPHIRMTAGAHSWRYHEDGEPELTPVADHAASVPSSL